MQLALVVGHATATIKHPSLQGWRLVLIQPLTADEKEEGEPQLAIDSLGANPSSLVIVSNDGAAARELVGAKNSPARWFVLGMRDR
jgi:ethanolamine utilization protein EutN